MKVELNEKELENLIGNYLRERDLGKKDNFMFNLNIKYYDGNYEVDSYHVLNASYSYSQTIKIFDKNVTLTEETKLSNNEVIEILKELFQREGYEYDWSYFDKRRLIVNFKNKERELIRKI